MQLAYLLVNIGGDNLAALTSLTHKQGSDLDCLLSDLTGVGGHNPKVRLLTEGAVVPLAAPLKPNRFWSALTIAGRRQLGPDKDVTQVFSSAEGDHGGEGHVLLGIIILVDRTLMLVVDHFGDGWESLIKGEGEYNTLVGRAGGLQEGVTSV